MKVFQGIIIGALFSGLLSAIYACYIAFTSNTVSDFGFTAKGFWWLYIILGGFFGFVIGGIIGGVVLTLNLNAIKGGLLGLLLTIIPACFFLLLSEKKFDEDITRFGIAFIIIATITGIITSLVKIVTHVEQ